MKNKKLYIIELTSAIGQCCFCLSQADTYESARKKAIDKYTEMRDYPLYGRNKVITELTVKHEYMNLEAHIDGFEIELLEDGTSKVFNFIW